MLIPENYPELFQSTYLVFKKYHDLPEKKKSAQHFALSGFSVPGAGTKPVKKENTKEYKTLILLMFQQFI
ncbi:MAG: hypothetical protein A2W90_17005 [Bacteroidetes bacterium GWF2_42_66]|nr:MAG: hypothetical protein A2W92_15730 [Bacteroidetes bacterium GWA2_42_15]OFX97768.1 MAG: hypothetical protein A2W89_07030 [Bacteroidetes bacterium GWE2_42_39]OFY45493.1 MAG: hypothetical protein A2W90_17005 [Bacteroidetes bacterium GWF2_42_66]HAZ02840.1 hypothetical protein [Marinilabiliales bacterium]HBL73786.1 hypothetical protein [Prolixibacteraceae bacterium]